MHGMPIAGLGWQANSEVSYMMTVPADVLDLC